MKFSCALERVAARLTRRGIEAQVSQVRRSIIEEGHFVGRTRGRNRVILRKGRLCEAKEFLSSLRRPNFCRVVLRVTKLTIHFK